MAYIDLCVWSTAMDACLFLVRNGQRYDTTLIVQKPRPVVFFGALGIMGGFQLYGAPLMGLCFWETLGLQRRGLQYSLEHEIKTWNKYRSFVPISCGKEDDIFGTRPIGAVLGPAKNPRRTPRIYSSCGLLDKCSLRPHGLQMFRGGTRVRVITTDRLDFEFLR